MFAYLSGSGPSKKDQEKIKAKTEAEFEKIKAKGERGVDKAKEGILDAKNRSEQELRKDGGAVGELSGRKGQMGGFRSE